MEAEPLVPVILFMLFLAGMAFYADAHRTKRKPTHC